MTMARHSRFAFAFVSSLLTFCLLTSPSLAVQTKKEAADNPEQKELLSYQLTMDKIHRLIDATKELKQWQDKNPDATKEMDENQPNDASSITKQTKLIDSKYPQASAIIKKHGFATREYLVGLYTFIQSSVVVGMKRSGQPIDPSKMGDVVSPANYDLVDKNWDEISKLNASMQ
jgi:hypothetical protein